MKRNGNNSEYSIESLCEAAGFTRQAHYAFLKRRRQDEHLYRHVYDAVAHIRQMHSCMGLRKIWYRIKPDWIGRDNFISIGVDLGLEIPKPKNYQRTTFSTRSNLYGNLTTNLKIDNINTVWVSDITYFYAHNIFYYITFIEDVYSRRIIGWVAARSLQAEESCTALKRALKTRSGMNLTGLIHHSDKGVQYTSDAYLKILKEHSIKVSLCDSVYENTHIERLNGIMKQEYLDPAHIKNFNHLIVKLNESVYLYNNERPHFSLDYLTPIEFERTLTEKPSDSRKTLVIWSDNNAKIKYQQCLLFN
jgi:putative transposase